MNKIRKKLLTLCCLCCSLTSLSAAENIFILVDVSGSMKYTEVNQSAKKLMYSLITGEYRPSDFAEWTIAAKSSHCPPLDTPTPLVTDGTYVCIIPFGNHETYKNLKYDIIRQNPIQNFSNFYNSNFPTVYKDQYTYLQIARATTGSIMGSKAQNLANAYVFLFSDNMPESVKSGDHYTQNEMEILNSLDMKGVNNWTKIAVLSRMHGNYTFQVSIYRVTQYDTPSSSEYIPIANETIVTGVSITSPKGTKNKPTKLENENLRLQWTGAPTHNYKINVVSENKKKSKTYQTTGNTYACPLTDSGDYFITVEDTDQGEYSQKIFVTVPAEFPWGFLIILLLIGIVGWLVYTFLNKKKPKPENHEENDTYTSKEDFTKEKEDYNF